MPNDSKIEFFLDLWEDLLERGEISSIEGFLEECCEDLNKELLAELREKIKAIEVMNQLIEDQGNRAPEKRDTEKRTQNTTKKSLTLKRGFEPVPGYRLLSPLGEGGFGEVWKAKGPGNIKVALKFVKLDHRAAETELRSLEVMKNIRHPNLLSVFGTWQEDGYLIIAAELAGKSLHDRFQSLREKGETGIPKRELLSYLMDAAKAIDHLNKSHHSIGDGKRASIQHRDIKPQNLLLSGGGLKVADFGIARFLENNATDHTGRMSLAFAAPEFFEGKTTDRSDQYSLAVTYCLLRSGELPFRGTDHQIMKGHLEDTPDLSLLSEKERPALIRALSKDPTKRWPNCRSFVKAIAGERASDFSVGSSMDQENTRVRKKNYGLITFIAMMVLLIGIGIGTRPYWKDFIVELISDSTISNNSSEDNKNIDVETPLIEKITARNPVDPIEAVELPKTFLWYRFDDNKLRWKNNSDDEAKHMLPTRGSFSFTGSDDSDKPPESLGTGVRFKDGTQGEALLPSKTWMFSAQWSLPCVPISVRQFPCHLLL